MAVTAPERPPGVHLDIDVTAADWVERQPAGPIVIARLCSRCCTGVRLYDLEVRIGDRRRARERFEVLGIVAGREVLVDRALSPRLPARIRLRVGGRGPFRGLRLDLDGEAWAHLIYD